MKYWFRSKPVKKSKSRAKVDLKPGKSLGFIKNVDFAPNLCKKAKAGQKSNPKAGQKYSKAGQKSLFLSKHWFRSKPVQNDRKQGKSPQKPGKSPPARGFQAKSTQKAHFTHVFTLKSAKTSIFSCKYLQVACWGDHFELLARGLLTKSPPASGFLVDIT